MISRPANEIARLPELGPHRRAVRAHQIKTRARAKRQGAQVIQRELLPWINI